MAGRTGLLGWMSKHLKGRKGQQGFTLIELLVVVTILGVLAAIVTLSLVGLTTNASAQACESEYKAVQAALDSYMAYYNVDTLPNSFGPTTNMNAMAGTGAPGGGLLWTDTPGAGTPTFTRNATTKYQYSWNTHGRITAIGNAPTGCAVQP